MEIALGCDFLVASDQAGFADTHARVGILPGAGMTARLPNRRGRDGSAAVDDGEVIDAARAGAGNGRGVPWRIEYRTGSKYDVWNDTPRHQNLT
jgi:hypothetical protein